MVDGDLVADAAPAVGWFRRLRTTVTDMRRAGAVPPDYLWSGLTNPLIWGTVCDEDYQTLLLLCRDLDMGTAGVRRVRAWWGQRGVSNLASAHRVLRALVTIHGPWASFGGERRPVRAPDRPGAYIPDVLQEIVMAEAQAGELAMMEAFHPASTLRRDALGTHAPGPAPPEFQRPQVETRRAMRLIDLAAVPADPPPADGAAAPFKLRLVGATGRCGRAPWRVPWSLQESGLMKSSLWQLPAGPLTSECTRSLTDGLVQMAK